MANENEAVRLWKEACVRSSVRKIAMAQQLLIEVYVQADSVKKLLPDASVLQLAGIVDNATSILGTKEMEE